MANLITAPIVGIEPKTVNKPGSTQHGRQYYIISFRTGDLFNPQTRRTTVFLSEDQSTAAEQKSYFDGLIASKQFGTIKGTLFTVGDVDENPNTKPLPLHRMKLTNGGFGPPSTSMKVFVRWNEGSQSYEMSPRRKAESIIYNPEMAEVLIEGTSDEPGVQGADPLV